MIKTISSREFLDKAFCRALIMALAFCLIPCEGLKAFAAERPDSAEPDTNAAFTSAGDFESASSGSPLGRLWSPSIKLPEAEPVQLTYDVGGVDDPQGPAHPQDALEVVAVVSGIAKGAFKGTKVKAVTVNSKTLTKKSVKSCFKGSKVKTVKVPKSKLKAYKKIFTKKNCGKQVTLKVAK